MPLHAEAQRASIREAVATQQHPERLSLLTPVTPWDEAAYRAHPERYLDVIEPGRALMPAAARPGVPVLTIVGPAWREVPSLGSIELQVRIAPRACVTWTSLDRGVFANGLTSISCQADDRGLATTRYTATPGTVAAVRILVASPMASGQGRLRITVTTHS